MTDAISVQDLIVEQEGLLAEGEAARRKLQDAEMEYKEVRGRVQAFNSKYGRVLQMMKED
jgi:hypothetical protein